MLTEFRRHGLQGVAGAVGPPDTRPRCSVTLPVEPGPPTIAGTNPGQRTPFLRGWQRAAEASGRPHRSPLPSAPQHLRGAQARRTPRPTSLPPAGFPHPALGAGTQTRCRCALHPAGLPELVLWDRYYEKYAFFLRFLETASHGSSFLAYNKRVKAARLLPVPPEQAPRPAVCSGGRCPPPG